MTVPSNADTQHAAKDAIRADPYASFDDQEPLLRTWLQSPPARRSFPAAATA